jgi:dolichol-phosphate mannosyltransferase
MNATDTATRTLPLPSAAPIGRVPSSGPSPMPPGEARAYAQPELSIVIPTRNEAGNIMPLVQRLEAAVTDRPVEIIFVDDSDDDTVAVIEAARDEARSEIVLAHRAAGQRAGGLGTAVVTGLRLARAPWVCVMDADLQHPPEIVAKLLAKGGETGASLVLASRYVDSGDTGSFGAMRKSLSQVSTTAARLMFPRRLRGVSDPMSGFFLVRRAVLPLDSLQPEGFKILLEILVRTPNLRIAEVGFHFGERFAGKSKASLREGARYLKHLSQLRFNAETLRFMRFLLIGLTGLLVNTLVLAAMTDGMRLFYLLSAVIATQASTLWNFALTETWVFSDRTDRRGAVGRLAIFVLMNNAALALRGPMMFLLTSFLGVHYIISNIISLIAIMVVRYTLADKVIWASASTKKEPKSVFSYNIHDIVTVVSEAELPELQGFMTEEACEKPTIRVRIGKVSPARRGQAAVEPAADGRRNIRYVEFFRTLGFGMDITLGETIEITASPILRRSPHVLYTNVVEPVLRWTFVEKGYALVHGACLAFGNDAYLVTARTDTGKTTTMLRILAQERRALDNGVFLADDLTLVSPSGRVLGYPKPMTISYHTLRAIDESRLTSRERFKLKIQSRVHSKSGRRFAFLLTSTKLPVATINAIVQMLVPPPKYPVTRLLPTAKVVREAKLAGLFIIERGGEGSTALEHDDALETLMTNCEDAYGFPPYPTIKSFLHGSNEHDLRGVERAIVTQAFDGCSAMLLRSTTMDWAQRIARVVHVPGAREEALGLDWPRAERNGLERSLEMAGSLASPAA